MEKKMRVWWCPQIGHGLSFYVPVKTVEEAKRLMDTLAAYDQFQFENNIKLDFCNAGGLQVWDEENQEWIDWEYEDDGDYYDNVDEYFDGNEEMERFTREVFSQVNFN